MNMEFGIACPRGKSWGKRNGFTLIELLAVIAIIAILSGLSMVGIGSVMNRARERSALQHVKILERGVENFFNDYNRMPVDVAAISNLDTGDESDDAKAFFDELSGYERATTNISRRNYLDIADARNQSAPQDGLLRDTTDRKRVTGLFDPWGQGYLMEFDNDYDGEIESSAHGENVTGVKVLIYSKGKGGADSSTESDEADDIKSW